MENSQKSTLSTHSAAKPSRPLYKHGLTSISAWISHHIPSQVWDEITYPFPNFVEVWDWVSSFIPVFIMDVITCWDQSQLLVKEPGPCIRGPVRSKVESGEWTHRPALMTVCAAKPAIAYFNNEMNSNSVKPPLNFIVIIVMWITDEPTSAPTAHDTRTSWQSW